MPSPAPWSLTWWPKEPEAFGDVYAAAAEPGGPHSCRPCGLTLGYAQLPDLFTPAHLSCLVLQLSSQVCEVPEILPINFFLLKKKKKSTWWKHFHLLWFPVYPTVIPFPQATLMICFLLISPETFLKHKPHNTKMHYVSSSYYIKIAYSTLCFSHLMYFGNLPTSLDTNLPHSFYLYSFF